MEVALEALQQLKESAHNVCLAMLRERSTRPLIHPTDMLAKVRSQTLIGKLDLSLDEVLHSADVWLAIAGLAGGIYLALEDPATLRTVLPAGVGLVGIVVGPWLLASPSSQPSWTASSFGRFTR